MRREELLAAGELHDLAPAEAAARGAALSGTLRVPVIPLLYSGMHPPFPARALQERLFGAGRGDTVSFRGYYDEVSGGLLRVEGEVAPWLMLPYVAAHYLPRREYGWSRFGRTRELREQAIALADPYLDFRAYDNDGADGVPDSGDDDGFADFVALVYAQPCPGDIREGGIWPHRAAMAPLHTADTSRATGAPIRVSDYVILPAVDQQTCGALQAGVLAHETGHALGLPDLYDYDGTSQGIGAWGLMGTGSHLAQHSPTHPDAWSKEQLGWVRVRWITDTTALTLQPVERDPVVYRFDLGEASGRYLLLENRQPLGSDRFTPGHGLLIWEVDPERGELGAWNRDERRAALRLVQADGRGDLDRGLRADAGDPFPGVQERRSYVSRLGTGVAIDSITEADGVIRAQVVPAGGVSALLPDRTVLRMTALAGGVTARHALPIRRSSELQWRAHSGASWLAIDVAGDTLQLRARPGKLRPGVYLDTLRIVAGDDALLATVLVSFHVAAPGVGQIVATELPWSWGLAAHRGRILHASYGWDPLGLRPRPRVLELREGSMHPATLARLPADALYAPVFDATGNAVFVLARARDRNYVYRIDAAGQTELIASDVGSDALYGAALLPDGDLLIAEWNGTLHRLRGRTVGTYAKLNANIYQIAADADGTIYAAAYAGYVIRLTPSGERTILQTGFEPGRLVAVAVTPAGDLLVGERGGEGRIVRLRADGAREVLYRSSRAQFYGLATDNVFVYALDLGRRSLLRIPLRPDPARVAAR